VIQSSSVPQQGHRKALVSLQAVVWQGPGQTLASHTVDINHCRFAMSYMTRTLFCLFLAVPTEVLPAMVTKKQTTKFLSTMDASNTSHLLTSTSHPAVTAEQLGKLEEQYGGFVSDVVRREKAQGIGAGYRVHQGGDRFVHGNETSTHDYGQAYAEYLNKLFDSGSPVQQVGEVGILKGSGVAMWLKLFPTSKVYGFDLDPSIFEANRANLKQRGMNDANLLIVKMDQTLDNSAMLKAKVGGRFSFIVDDGCHTEFCAWMTIKSFLPIMDQKFVYIIEDLAGINLGERIKGLAPGINTERRGNDELLVVSRGL